MFQKTRTVRPNEAATGEDTEGEVLEVPQIEDALKAAEAEQHRAAGEAAAKALTDELARSEKKTLAQFKAEVDRLFGGGCGCGG